MVSENWRLGGIFLGVLSIRTLLFGVYIRAPDFWNLPKYRPFVGSRYNRNESILCFFPRIFGSSQMKRKDSAHGF